MANNLIPDEAFTMTGLWFNPYTGDSFEVRDNYCDGSDVYIIAKDGRQFKYNEIEKYIQATHEDDIRQIHQMKEMKKQNDMATITKANNRNTNTHSSIPQEVASLLDDYCSDDPGLQPTIIRTPTISAPQPVVPAPAVNTVQAADKPSYDNEDTIMIRRLMSKQSRPKVKVMVEWSKFPSKQLDMLSNYMCISTDAIADFYRDDFDVDSIRVEVIEAVKAELDRQLDKINDTTVEKEEEKESLKTLKSELQSTENQQVKPKNEEQKSVGNPVKSAKPAVKPAKPAAKKK